MGQYLRLTQPDKTRWTDYAVTYLKDAAFDWWISELKRSDSPSQTFSWNKFEQVCRQRWEVTDVEQSVANQLDSLRQMGNILDYNAEIQKIINKMPPHSLSEGMRLHYYIKGLKPKFRTGTVQCAAVREAMTIAERLESVLGTEMEKGVPRQFQQRTSFRPRSIFSTTPTMSTVQKPPPVRRLTYQTPHRTFPSARRTSNGRGSSLGDVANMFQEVRNIHGEQEVQRLLNEQRCFSCKQAGHQMRDCPEEKSVNNLRLLEYHTENQGEGESRND